MEVSLGQKITFFAKFPLFWLGPILGGHPVLGKILMHFQPGCQKCRKKVENHEKVENFRFSKIDPNVKIWTYGGQFCPKNHVFCKIFTFFFGLGPILGGLLVLWKILMHFRSGTTSSIYLFAEQWFP